MSIFYVLKSQYFLLDFQGNFSDVSYFFVNLPVLLAQGDFLFVVVGGGEGVLREKFVKKIT